MRCRALILEPPERAGSATSLESGWFSAAIRRAQETDRELLAITVHDLRHTATSPAISTGANVKAVQRMLGQASAAMTLDVYADLFDDNLDAVARSLTVARDRAVTGA
ncbi:MAG: tyrosine-type recombinase/integrase [Microbacteriaceae bacterium]|nr:tyrosine-type recombinase/integrase [Microbacteriaceae bacterium]